MTIASLATYLARKAAGWSVNHMKSGGSASVNSMYAGFTFATPDAATSPTTPVVCDGDTAGAINKQWGRLSAGDRLFGHGATHEFKSTPTIGDSYETAGVLLVDRLSHQGGIAGNVVATHTTNLPTAALTRYTSGVGVMVAVCAYVSATANTYVTMSYTNQDGTAGRTGVCRMQGGGRSISYMSFQAGDTGARSVQSVTVPATTASTNLGVILYKPLSFLFLQAYQGQFYEADAAIHLAMNMPTVESNPCLDVWAMSALSTQYHRNYDFRFGRDT